MSQPLRIAQVAPPMERVPPKAYGGTERVIVELVRELDRRGHELTTFASGDSEVPGRLIATVPEALRPAGYSGDAAPYFYLTIRDVLDRAHEFDLIHSHLEWAIVPAGPRLADPGGVDHARPAGPALGAPRRSRSRRPVWSPSARTRRRRTPRSTGPASSTTG